MPEEIYDRQKSLGLHVPSSVMVVGTGGVGYWVSILLAMSGVKILHIVDPDIIELSNLNRLPITTDAINVSKVEALKEHLLALRPDCTVYAHKKKFDKLIAGEVEWIVSCTDNVKSQKQTERWSKKIGAKFVRAGYDGLHLTLTDAIPEWGEDKATGYTVTPSWVIPSVLIAAFAVAKMLRFPDMSIASYICELGKKTAETTKTKIVDDGHNVYRAQVGELLSSPLRIDIFGEESADNLWDISNCGGRDNLEQYARGEHKDIRKILATKDGLWNWLDRMKNRRR